MTTPDPRSYPAQVRHLLFGQEEIQSEALLGFAEGWTVAIGLWRAPNGFDASYRSHPHASLSFVRGGAPVRRMDGRFAGREGGPHPDCFMLYPGFEPRRYIARGDIRLGHLYFAPSMVAELSEREFDKSSAGLALRNDRVLAHDPRLRRMIDDYVMRAQDRALAPSKLEMDARCVLLGLHLLHHHTNRAPAPLPGRGNTGLGRRQLDKVLDCMHAAVDQELSLDALSDVAGLSRHYFCKAFKASTGVSPHQYVIGLRVERAKIRLLGQDSMAEIALSCGFGSQQHFAATFRKVTGTTPGAWRRAARG